MYKMETRSILYQSKKVQEILSSTQYIINFNATQPKVFIKVCLLFMRLWPQLRQCCHHHIL